MQPTSFKDVEVRPAPLHEPANKPGLKLGLLFLIICAFFVIWGVLVAQKTKQFPDQGGAPGAINLQSPAAQRARSPNTPVDKTHAEGQPVQSDAIWTNIVPSPKQEKPIAKYY